MIHHTDCVTRIVTEKFHQGCIDNIGVCLSMKTPEIKN